MTRKKVENRVLLELFQQLKELLQNEDTTDIGSVVSGVDKCIEILEKKEKDWLTQVIHIHFYFYPPEGGLTDFFIYRDDEEENRLLNTRLEKLKGELWRLLEG